MGNLISGLSKTAEQALGGRKLDGKTALVTGGSSGIGLETVRVLALAGARVYVATPHVEKAKGAIEKIRPNAGSNPDIRLMSLDLASFRSIREFVSDFKAVLGTGHLDFLILNAAVMQTPQWMTREGFDYQTGVNYLGHVELTQLLLRGLLLQQAVGGREARILVITCQLPLQNPRLLVWRDLNFKSRQYSSGNAYAQSKIALAVWGEDLANRLSGVNNLGVFIIHPGVAVTSLNRFLPFFSVIYDMAVAPFVKSLSQAAATSIHCCVASNLVRTSNGAFFDNCKPVRTPACMLNPTLAENLRKKTDELLSEAVVDSHQPIDYNPGRLMFAKFKALFLGPLLRQLGYGGHARQLQKQTTTSF